MSAIRSSGHLILLKTQDVDISALNDGIGVQAGTYPLSVVSVLHNCSNVTISKINLKTGVVNPTSMNFTIDMIMPDFGKQAVRKVLNSEPIIWNVSGMLEADPQCPLKQFRVNNTLIDGDTVSIDQY